MENEIVLAKTSIVKKMDAEYGKCANGYIRFAGLVGICRAKEAYRDEGYNTVYDLCKERYSMSRGTVQNLCKIYENFCDSESGKLLPEYEGKKVTALLARLKATKEEIGNETETEESAEKPEIKEESEEKPEQGTVYTDTDSIKSTITIDGDEEELFAKIAALSVDDVVAGKDVAFRAYTRFGTLEVSIINKG